MSLKNQALSGVKWTFLQQVSVQVINFGVQIALARLLAPDMFGLIAIIIIFVNVGQKLMDGGMTSSLIRTESPTQIDYSTVYITNILVSLVIYGVIFHIAPYIADFYDEDVLTSLIRVLALKIIIQSMVAVHIAKLTKEMDFKLQLKIQLPASIFAGFVGIFLASFGFGVWALVALNITQATVYTILGLIFINWTPTLNYSLDRFKFHFGFGYKLTLSGLIDVIYNDAYRIIIGKYYSPVMAGYFHQAETLRIFPVNQISTVMGKVTYPLFSNINCDVGLKKAYKLSMRIVISITAPVMLSLILVAEDLFHLLFGELWLPAVPFFQILAMASIIRPISSYNLNILKVKGRSDLFLKLEVMKKIIGILAMLIGFQFDILGLIISLSLVSYVWWILEMIVCGRLIRYSAYEQIKDISPIFLIALLSFCFSFLIKNNFFIYNLSLISSILIMCTAYFFVYLFFVFILQREFVNKIKYLIN